MCYGNYSDTVFLNSCYFQVKGDDNFRAEI